MRREGEKYTRDITKDKIWKDERKDGRTNRESKNGNCVKK
jgi:hypothetical protein